MALIEKTIKVADGDYTNLTGWEFGEQQDLTDGAGDQHETECFPMQDTTATTIAGWTASGTNYALLKLPSSNRPTTGKLDTDCYYMDVQDGTALSLYEDGFRFEYFQIEVDANGSNSYCLAMSNNHILDLRFLSCYFKFQSTGAVTPVGCNHNGTFIDDGGFIKYQNCTFEGNDYASDWHTACRWLAGAGQTGALYFYNCSFKDLHDCLWLILGGDGALCLVKNCGADSCDDLYNAGASAPTTETTNSETTPTWDTYFLLDSADVTWKGQGTDLTADGGRLNELDFLENARPNGSAWSIGAHEPSAAAAVWIPRVIIF